MTKQDDTVNVRLLETLEKLADRVAASDLAVLERYADRTAEAFNRGYSLGRQHGEIIASQPSEPMPPGTNDALREADAAVNGLVDDDPDEPIGLGLNGAPVKE